MDRDCEVTPPRLVALSYRRRERNNHTAALASCGIYRSNHASLRAVLPRSERSAWPSRSRGSGRCASVSHASAHCVPVPVRELSIVLHSGTVLIEHASNTRGRHRDSYIYDVEIDHSAPPWTPTAKPPTTPPSLRAPHHLRRSLHRPASMPSLPFSASPPTS